jgi:ABC-2 type transport system permease protein
MTGPTGTARDRVVPALWATWAAAVMQARQQGLNPGIIVLGILQPVVFLTITLRASAGLDPADVERITVAVVLTVLWNTTIWIAGGILRSELRQGTLAASLTGPYPGYLILFGKCLGALAHASGVIVASTAATLLVTRTPLRFERPGWALLGAALALVSGTVLGTLIATLFIRTQHGPQLSGALMYPIYLLGGMLIPPGFLPEPLQWLSAAISLRWASAFISHAVGGSVRVGELLALVGLTVGYGVLAVWLFVRVVVDARREGRLALD